MKVHIKNVVIIILCIILNCVGRYIAQHFNLPIWFDTAGTFIASYFTGLWGGIITGAANNIIAAVAFDVTSLAYTVTSVVAAVIIYFLIKKDYLSNLFKAVVVCFWMGLVCTLVSTPINLIFYNGYSGNYWGDTLVDMLRWYEVSDFVSSLAGEAVVEIIDKQVCVLVAFLIILAVKHIRKGTIKNHTQVTSFILVAGMVCGIAGQALCIDTEAVNIYDDNFVEKIYNNTNGMVSSEANTICETNDGYIWIGSYAGLSRYDGTEFEFVLEGGLVNVVDMMTDSRGRLWIGTNDAGIARYENGKYTYFTVEDNLPTNSVRCFAEDSQGNIYVGTSGKICIFTPEDEIIVTEYEISFVKSMVVYANMLVVMDNNGDIYAIDGEKQLKLEDRGDELFYYSLAATSKGLMVGTESGELFVAELGSDEFRIREQIDISADMISVIMEDSKERIWIATGTGFGYVTSDGIYREMQVDGFDSSFSYFHEDYQGNLWLASSHYGVMKLSESSFVNMFEKNGAEGEVVNAVTYYDGHYFCGTDNGLVVFDNNGISSKYSELTSAVDGSRVRSLFVDSENRLWLCTYNGLWCFSKQGEMRCYNMESDGTTSDRFRCITELEDGTLAVGTADGINFIRDGAVVSTLTADDGLENTQILSIVEGKDGTVWAGSDGSGIYIISDGKLEEMYSTKNGLSSDVILRIVPYEKGYVVVTSNSLFHIDLKGKIRKLSGFPYFNNYDVIIDGETAYIPCSAGLYETKLSELCDDKGQYKLYGANEGLLSGLTANSWNYVADDGRIFLCGNSGVVVFNSAADGENSEMKYGIVSVECDGNLIDIASGSFTIPENTQELSISASVRNYVFADVRVKFYIEELENNPKAYRWNEIEPIRIFKPDLAEYNICLQILDESEERVLDEKVYKISKKVHTWEKPEFIAYLVFVCAEGFIFFVFSLMSFVFFVLRKGQLEKIQIELERKVKVQTAELVDKQKTIKELFVQTVTALSEAVDAKDRYTSGHSKRVAEYARMIAARMGKSKEEQEEIYRAGLLHDVGKIRIPVEIINKAGKLTDEEFNIIKVHPVTGYHILRGISGNRPIAIAAKYHHERYDGKGYPNGLEGDRIPETARILGVADSYDAMTSNRSYRQALPQDVVRKEIEKGKGTQFDPVIAEIMLQMIDEDKDYTMKQTDWMYRRILVVDDERFNHKVIQSIMRDEPMYEINCAKSGHEALQLLEEHEYNLILLDVMMPDMNGIEVLREIRKKYSTPVVLMTADKTLDTSTEFAAYGCDDYITKPFLPLLLKEVIHNMTERTTIEE